MHAFCRVQRDILQIDCVLTLTSYLYIYIFIYSIIYINFITLFFNCFVVCIEGYSPSMQTTKQRSYVYGYGPYLAESVVKHPEINTPFCKIRPVPIHIYRDSQLLIFVLVSPTQKPKAMNQVSLKYFIYIYVYIYIY